MQNSWRSKEFNKFFPPPNQKRQPLPFLLFLSFFYAWNPLKRPLLKAWIALMRFQRVSRKPLMGLLRVSREPLLRLLRVSREPLLRLLRVSGEPLLRLQLSRRESLAWHPRLTGLQINLYFFILLKLKSYLPLPPFFPNV